MQDEEDVLDVRNLGISFRTPAGEIPAVRDVSFRIRRGETLALVGESGSGKSVTSLGILRLTPKPPFCSITGQVLLRGRDGTVRDLASLPEDEMRDVRGRDAAMVFQEPMTSLNPVHRVGDQIAESIRFHEGLSRRAALDKAAGLLDLVGIPDPRRRLGAYPHELSGGMRQRVMIAMALACEPRLLIADEPTTALDVTIQAQILDLLRRLQERTRMAVIFITHNLGVVAEIADRVMVMYSGRVVEQAAVRPLFRSPLMPYTRGLLRSVPRLDFAGLGREPLAAIPGTVPDPLEPPPGCSFGPRCGGFLPGTCDAAVPPLEEARPGHQVRCVRWSALTGEAA
ncbi:peptide ABC transporter ATP-binding protein [Pseudoroseomonas rhizosphaerae]|uniref:Peptide ABC transporter ATP-binding protein n=2 Tax=Teichococcus rhizosphaerae TaxID=1335062 RepID=A0A2C7AA02_9PROT|nr:peptide ABC transporter ATP-binding protein [Pseudoroseomonas rhizosphaerae]